MKKKLLAVLLAASMLTLAACGSKSTETEGTADTTENTDSSADESGEEQSENSAIEGPQYLKEFNAADYVTLGEYKGLEVTLADPEVSDEYLDSYIQYMLQYSPVSTPVTGRAVEVGDTVDIDYEGKLDGVAFDGGTAKGSSLTIGSGRFIPGFEDGVVGMEIGETKDVEATFPDPYQNNPDLAGKVAVFTVTLNGISTQEIPELTDEYVEGLAIENVKTVEDYKDYVYELLMEQEQSSYESQKSNIVIEAAAANAEFKDAPEGMVARMNQTLTNNISSYASMYGVDTATYVSNVYGGTAEEYEETLLGQAQMMAQRYLMMQAIAEAEGLTVTDEEIESQLETEAANYGYETAEEYKAAIDVEAFREYLMTQNVIQFLSEHAVVSTGETKQTADTEKPETDDAADTLDGTEQTLAE